MIKLRSIFVLSVLSVLSVWAQTSNVQTVRAWTRTHVMGIPDGGLLDPTGTLADAQRLDVANAVINGAGVLVDAAHTGLTNALERLYSAAARTNDFTGRVFIAADLDDDPGYSNVWSAVVGETVDTDGTLHYFCHYSRELAAPPKTRWAFELADGMTLWAYGVVSTNNVMTNCNGYACYDIAVTRPAGVGGSVLRANKFMRFGTPETPLVLPDAGFQIVTNAVTSLLPFTGADVTTNAEASVVVCDTYLSGLLYQSTTNLIGGTP